MDMLVCQCPDMTELLTLAEVAERLKVNERTVRRRIKDRTLPVVRIGGIVRVRAEDVDELTQSAVDADPREEDTQP